MMELIILMELMMSFRKIGWGDDIEDAKPTKTKESQKRAKSDKPKLNKKRE